MRRIVEAARAWLLASPRHVGYAVVLAALVLTIPFGGLRAAPQEELGRTPAGQPVAVAPFEITLEEAVHGQNLGGSFSAVEGRRHLLLRAKVRTTATETVTVSVLANALRMRTPGLATAYGTPLKEDGSLGLLAAYEVEPTPQVVSGISPGLTYDLAIALSLPADAPVPPTLEVELLTQTWRQSSLESTMIWTDEAPTTVVEVPTRARGQIFTSVWELAP